MGVSGGIAIGRAVCIETRGPDIFRLHIAEDQVEAEVERLQEGAAARPRRAEADRATGPGGAGQRSRGIFDAHVLLLSDRNFLGRVEERIRAHQVNAEWAVHKTAEELDDRFAHIDDAYLRERART